MFIYGKHFSRMYQGSMVGAGFGPYAVMGYVIANQQPGADGLFRVDLNSKLLATTFGEPEGKIEEAIEFLCAPDEKSTTPAEEGRRLVKEGPFLYRVVNGAVYAKIRNEEERREQNRLAQERHRAKKKGVNKGPMLPGEALAMRAASREEAEKIGEGTLPDKLGSPAVARSPNSHEGKSVSGGAVIESPLPLTGPPSGGDNSQVGLPVGPEFLE